MNPGKLDRRIVLQKRVVTADNTGSRVQTWADESSVWAEYVVNRGGERVIADSEKSQDSQQFRVRYRPSLIAVNASTDYRILYQSKFFNIRGIAEEGGRQNTLLIDTIATQATP